jgi:hypothetical protein
MVCVTCGGCDTYTPDTPTSAILTPMAGGFGPRAAGIFLTFSCATSSRLSQQMELASTSSVEHRL